MSREETENASAKTASEAEMHRPPSVLWFVIPLVGLVVYALLSR